MRTSSVLIVLGLITVGAAGRLLAVQAELVNVSPVGAIALFCGATFASRRHAVLIPMLAMLVSDLLLYGIKYQQFAAESWKTALLVYLGFALMTGLGGLLRKRRGLLRLTGVSLLGSLVFFVLSNLAAWLFFDMYPRTLAGLVECYAAAIPFFRGQSPLLNSLVSDLVFTAALFGAAAWFPAALSRPAAEQVSAETLS